MCFFEQLVHECDHCIWGRFRQHCNREYRTGETCGMKLVMSSTKVPRKCKICQIIEVNVGRIKMEQRNLLKWDDFPADFKALSSRENPQEIIRRLEKEIELLQLGLSSSSATDSSLTARHRKNPKHDVQPHSYPPPTPGIAPGRSHLAPELDSENEVHDGKKSRRIYSGTSALQAKSEPVSNNDESLLPAGQETIASRFSSASALLRCSCETCARTNVLFSGSPRSPLVNANVWRSRGSVPPLVVQHSSNDAPTSIQAASNRMLSSWSSFANFADAPNHEGQSRHDANLPLQQFRQPCERVSSEIKPASSRRRSLRLTCHLLIACGGVLLCVSSALAICWSVVKKDVSGGFTMGSYVATMGTIPLGLISAKHYPHCSCFKPLEILPFQERAIDVSLDQS